MAGWEDRTWRGVANAPSFADRASGSYRSYVPDLLVPRPLVLEPDVSALAWEAEAAVRGLGNRPGARGLEGLARFLLRSEAIASSRIEGLQVSPQQVGLAEIADEEAVTAQGVNQTARRVAANIYALRRATHELAGGPAVTLAGVSELQALLLADEPELHGVRDEQNWIGGSAYHPLSAEFVPPAPRHVDGLMEDLVDYLNHGAHAPLVQAGMAHAQFETIHPFRDGNGRVGRALIHTVLVRRGLTTHAVLPISPVLLTRSQEYVDGLTAYRHSGDAAGAEATAAVSAWLRVFLQAVAISVSQAEDFAARLDELRGHWDEALASWRYLHDRRETPRADSATARILETLQEHPVLTASSVVRLFDVSRGAAARALDELSEAGVLTRRRLDGRTSAYLSMDVFELITSAERRLASTRWDTGHSRPARPVPYPTAR
ncbi:Fic family protein [Blastococcus colisei]|uniref:Fic family protein n=1 Tax=Blastococcus colisei TaxID=1564162 RepID=A0A543P1D0_9ACTN|nr:Fic family protein [Blastococcus colisei]TQN37925.1 Fic family protein [Blastococcus colisei]